MGTDHLDVRGLEDKNGAVAPHKSIDLERYTGQHIPTDWDITGVTGDIIMCEYVDEDEQNDEYVTRGSLLVPKNLTKEMWRVGRIVKAGPGASDQCHGEEVFIMFPNDRGIPITKFGGRNYIFINEERIFCFVHPKGKKLKAIREKIEAMDQMEKEDNKNKEIIETE